MREVLWSLRDVLFTEGLHGAKVGTVVKVDGLYVAVHFPALEGDEVGRETLANCRLLRRDDLIVSYTV